MERGSNFNASSLYISKVFTAIIPFMEAYKLSSFIYDHTHNSEVLNMILSTSIINVYSVFITYIH